MSFKLPHLVFAILLTAGLFASTSVKVLAATFEEQTVTLINTERQKANLTPLLYNEKLFQASENHNNTMYSCSTKYGRTSCFVHQVTLLSEQRLIDRVKATGYNPKSVAENIAWGYTTPSSVVSGWMNSSGHKANILGNYKDIGCDYLNALNGSYTGMYWTCDFGISLSTTSSSPTLTPTSAPTPTLSPTLAVTLAPTPTTTTTAKPWWCVYAPTHSMCK